MPSPPPPSCCLCPEVEYNAGTTTLKTENVIGYVTDIVLSPLFVSEDNPHCRLCEQWGSANGTDGSNPPWYNFPISFPDICYQVVTNRKDNGWGAVDGNSAGACDWNKTQVRIYSNDRTVPVNYIAIGK